MSVLDQIARGFNIDPAGNKLRATIDAMQLQQGAERHSLAQELGGIQRDAGLRNIQTQKQAAEATSVFAQYMLEDLADEDVPDFLRKSLASDNPTLQAMGVKQGLQMMAPQKASAFMERATLFASNPEFFRAFSAADNAGTGTSVTVNNPGEKKLIEGEVKFFNETELPKLSIINDSLRNIAQTRKLLKTAKTGFGADIQTSAARLFESVGLGSQLAGLTPEQLESNEAMPRLTLLAASEMFAMQKGPISDREFATIISASPNILKTKGGITQLLELMETSSKFNRETIIAHRRWLQEKPNDGAGWLEEEARLVDEFMAQQMLPEGAVEN